MTSVVICDTNLLVSAAIFPNSVPARAYEQAIANHSVAVSDETLAELSKVLNRPKIDKYIDLATRLRFLEDYRRTVLSIAVTHSVQDCRDPKDDKFLNLALSSSAHCIITGDPDLLVLHPYYEIQILSPAAFLNQLIN